MAEETGIGWCRYTFCCWYGCTEKSDECAHCYARDLTERFPETFGVWGRHGTRIISSERQWRLPLKWDRRAAKGGVRERVFCTSMGDVFEGPETMPAAF